jgi:PRC-barrel domain
VQNRDGDTVAEIVDLVKRQGEEDLFAVLSVGGFLGMGDKKVVVPVNELEVDPEGQIIMAAVSEEQLKNVPEYQEEGFESTAQAEQPPAQQQ